MLHLADEHTFESSEEIDDSIIFVDETCLPDHLMPEWRLKHVLAHEECGNHPEVL